jgi:uncharacterized pyridoxamine 5'-phosphate oxidase family protein
VRLFEKSLMANNKVYFCVMNNNEDFTNNRNKIIFPTLESAHEYVAKKCEVTVSTNREGDYVTKQLITAHIYEVNYGELIDTHKPYEFVYKDKEDYTIQYKKCSN